MANLPTTIEPEYMGLSKNNVFSGRRQMTFGSGYTQRGTMGINNVHQEYSLRWIGTEAQITELEDFLTATKGTTAFDWIPPHGSTSQKWTCAEPPAREFIAEDVDALTAKFKREFDLT